MPAREVLQFPHPALKQAARMLGRGEDERVAQVTADLLDTMRAHQGCVGLAAPQVGELVRIVAVDVSEHPRADVSHGLLVLVNPRIARTTGSEVAREGCLSIPHLTANVRRAVEISVEAMDPAGAATVIDTAGFEARCIQHELDHLDGILFLDRVDSLKTDVFRRKNYGGGVPSNPRRGAASRSPTERTG